MTRILVIATVVSAFSATAACDLIGTERPPLVVDRRSGSGGVAGSGETPTPTGGAPTNGAPLAAVSPACWADQFPEVQARLPQRTVDEACALAATTTEWTFPAMWTGTSSVHSDDHRGDIAGRWVRCGSSTVSAVPHDGIEFGANARWQLLKTDAAGSLIPADPAARGYYYLLASGQLDLNGEGVTGENQIFFLRFAPGMDTLRFDDSSTAIYARTTPSPLNGRDNVPTVTDGRCSMVGTWDVPANEPTPYAPAATLSFDEAGNFVGGDRGSDLCSAHTMYGTYRLSPNLFQLTTNVNMGQCQFWFSAGYPTHFDASCTHLTLMQLWDNCTGGRGLLNGTTTLTRRP
jgi:hypothetical protein